MYAPRFLLLLVILVAVAAIAVGCGGATTATVPATPTATTTPSAAPTKATPTPDPWSGNWVSIGMPPTMYVHLAKVGSHTYRVRLLPGDGTAYKGTAILHGSRLVSKRGTFVVDATGLFLLGAHGALFKPTKVAVETMSPTKWVAPRSTPTPKPTPKATPKPTPTGRVFTEGTYLVGTDMPPGLYKGETIAGSGYWQIASDANGSNIIANNNVTGQFYVQAKRGQFLELVGVTITRVGP